MLSLWHKGVAAGTLRAGSVRPYTYSLKNSGNLKSHLNLWILRPLFWTSATVPKVTTAFKSNNQLHQKSRGVS